jgi:hypothetical protein
LFLQVDGILAVRATVSEGDGLIVDFVARLPLPSYNT